MSKKNLLLSALFVCIIFTLFSRTTFAAAGKQPDSWNYYHFNGSAFIPGIISDGGIYLAVGKKVQPVVVKSQATAIKERELPDGTGVIAGICYFQSSGGKLAGGSSFKPCSRSVLIISTEGKQLVSVQTDEDGYFLVVLPSGKYSIGSDPFSTEISVESETTTLVPLRAGKRMAD